MKIYIDSGGTAPSPRRVRIYLAEKGIEVPYERLKIHEENRTPESRLEQGRMKIVLQPSPDRA